MPKKLCFVVNNAAFFASHRLPIAIKFIQLGGQVDLIIGKPGSEVMEGHAVNEIESHGIRIWRVPLSTSGVNPILELIGLYHVQRHLRAIQPDVVHCASPKGVIHGGLGARIAGVKSVVFSVSGLGFAFTSTDNSLTRRIARKAFEAVAKIAFVHENKRVIVQNTQDYNELIDLGVAQPSNLVVTKGSGTDVAKIAEVDIESKEKLVVLPSRLIRDKGVCEYLEASNQLASRHPDWTFAVIGANDYDNPSRLSDSELERYTQKENVIWLPHSEDISSLLRRTSIVCLPSYREGMPKALLDAAAAGCAIVTTDVPGCSEAIIPDETGDIVPVKSINELREALSNLIKEESRRHRYAARALEFARDELDRDTVVRINLDQYDDLLSDDVLKPVVLFLVTEDWYFLSHRLPTAKAAAKAGARVIVATSCGKRFREIEAHGFEVIDIPISRFSLSPAKELLTIINVWRVFRSLRPAIVHNVAWKPILYGSMAGQLAGVPKIINNFCGLGMVFTSREKRFLLLRFVVVTIFRALSKSKQHIMLFQNQDDWAHLAGLGIGREANYRLVPGSGVDLDKFPIRDSTKKVMNFAIVSRMIRDKGVLECVAAVKWLAEQDIQCKLLLVGEPDPKNPQSISQEELRVWSEHSHIEYCGFVDDIKSIWDRAEVALLPSYYGEGVPKCLLEAAASGRPLIATDMPGCRDVVLDGYNGYLVKPRDVADLAAKIKMLLNEPEQVPLMGQASRMHVQENFSSDVVTKIMEGIYLEQLGISKPMEIS